MNGPANIPPDASAALYFLPGQYLFANFQEGATAIKALSTTQVARAFQDVNTDTGWLGRYVLRYREAPEGNSILSYEPASARKILVVSGSGEIEELKIPLPTLILLSSGRDHYLWAAASSTVSPKTKLAVAPLPNIGSGKICFGRNDVPETHGSTLNAVWKLIFETPFNRDHAKNRCNSHADDIRILLKKIAADKLRKFPKSELITSTSTVEDAWETLVERRRYDSRF